MNVPHVPHCLNCLHSLSFPLTPGVRNRYMNESTLKHFIDQKDADAHACVFDRIILWSAHRTT